MATPLRTTTTMFTFSELEAEGLVENAKDQTEGYIIEHNIRRKEKKEEVYYIVKIVEELNKEKDLV